MYLINTFEANLIHILNLLVNFNSINILKIIKLFNFPILNKNIFLNNKSRKYYNFD